MNADEALHAIAALLGPHRLEHVYDPDEIVRVLKDMIPASDRDQTQDLVVVVEQLAVAKNKILRAEEQACIDAWRVNGTLTPEQDQIMIEAKRRLIDAKP